MSCKSSRNRFEHKITVSPLYQNDGYFMVEYRGIEPLTSRLRTLRSAEWYTKRALEYRFSVVWYQEKEMHLTSRV